jgi:hypothetical protein
VDPGSVVQSWEVYTGDASIEKVSKVVNKDERRINCVAIVVEDLKICIFFSIL